MIGERNTKYISSDGTEKDTRTLDYQYLVNALAKAYRNLNEVETYEEFIKNSDNVCVLQDEILIRNKDYFEKHFGKEDEQNG